MKKIAGLSLLVIIFIFSIYPDGYAARAAKGKDAFYGIQVGAYDNLQVALAKVRELKDEGLDAYDVKAVLSTGEWHRVCIGRYRSGALAVAAGEKLKTEGVIDAFTARKILRDQLSGTFSESPGKGKKSEVPGVEKSKERTSVRAVAAAPARSDVKKKPGSQPEREPLITTGLPARPGLDAEVKKKEDVAVEEDGKGKILSSTRETSANAVAEQERAASSGNRMAASSDQSSPLIPPETVLPPEAKTEAPKSSAVPSYESAVNDYQAGKYEEAVKQFEELLQKNSIEEEKRERAVRYIADGYYFLGEKGNPANVKTAIEHYKNILKHYPNATVENELVSLRIAKGYLISGMYKESLNEFEAFYSSCPESRYAPEGLFNIGVSLYRVGRFTKAVDHFNQYLSKYPKGEYVKASYYWIADCYTQMQDLKTADQWYRDAIEKWPDYTDLPKDHLVSLGFHHFRGAGFGEVVEVFSFFMSVYPEDRFRKDVLYLIGRSLTEMNQYKGALKIFSLLIERYPDSNEAMEGAVIMANIGVKQPGLKLPVFMAGQQYCRDPIGAYNALMAKNPKGEMEEGILFQKSYALWKMKRYREAFETYIALVRRHPEGKYKDAGMEHLQVTVDYLIDECYTKGDYLGVADVYYEAYDKGMIKNYDFRTGFRIADSLKRVGLYGDSFRVFEEVLRMTADLRDKHNILMAMAEINTKSGKYDEAESLLQKVLNETSARDRRVIAGVRKLMADVYYRKGASQKAAAAYSEVIKSGQDVEDMAVLYRNYANALRDSNACPTAIPNYQLAIKNCDRKNQAHRAVLMDSYAGLADCHIRDRKYAEALSLYRYSLDLSTEGAPNLWDLYNMGRTYSGMGNAQEANKVFAELKVKSGDDFWSKAIEYSLQDSAWTGKYQNYLNGR
jgi:tetratricopeptide (TPR) repeat protein